MENVKQPKFLHNNDKFDNFTKSLKITHFGVLRLFFTKFHYVKKEFSIH